MVTPDRARRRRNPRTWIVTYWTAGSASRRKEIQTIRLLGLHRPDVFAQAKAAAPLGTAKITVASPLHYGSRQPGKVSLSEQLALAEPGQVFWVQGIAPTASAVRARVRCDFTVFYAFPFNQARTGDDVSACERVRLTRVTVLGPRQEPEPQ